MSPAPASMEAALSDLERAIARDGSHVVLATAPGPDTDILTAALAERLEGPFRAVRVAAPTLGIDDLARSILARLGEPAVTEPQVRLSDVARELAEAGSALVVLVRNANAMTAEALARLGHLARTARPGLRLGFIVECDGEPGLDDIGPLVTSLGVGVEKIVLETLGDPSRPVVRGPLRATQEQTPTSGARRRGAMGWARIGLVAMAAGLAMGLVGVQRLHHPSEPSEVRSVASRGRIAPRPIPEARPAPVPTPAVQIEPKEEPRQVALPSPPPRTVRVSVNAQPWARVDIDGTDAGVTPLGTLRLTEGRHRVRARLPNGQTIEKQIEVGANDLHLSFP